MTDAPRMRPRAFRLDAGARPDAPLASEGVVIAPAPDVFAAPPLDPVEQDDEHAVEVAQRRGVLRRSLLSWSGLFWSALTGLIGLGVSVWATNVIESLFARSPTLGWLGAVLAGAAILALAVMATRELRGVFRQRRIAQVHSGLAQARADDDRAAARGLVAQLVALYEDRPDTARARALAHDLTREIVDGRDLIDIAERNLMAPLDDRARREIAAAAKRVSVVTAIAPRAIVDVLFVGAQSMRLIRRIAEIYGGRPSALGFWRLARSVGAHLAITGGMAVGDSLVQQILGHGIAARLSARLGEGVLNGMLTTRIGLSAMAVCRPMPYAALKPPGVGDVAPFLFGRDKGREKA